jgi:hypothetical protein
VTRAILALAVAAVLACSCQPFSSSPPVPTPDVVSPVDGVVVSVDASGLTDVRGFVLRVSSGFAFDFVLGPLENPTAFPPGHLAEHQATSAPVRVYFHLDGGKRVVYRLEDAVPVSPAPNAT